MEEEEEEVGGKWVRAEGGGGWGERDDIKLNFPAVQSSVSAFVNLLCSCLKRGSVFGGPWSPLSPLCCELNKLLKCCLFHTYLNSLDTHTAMTAVMAAGLQENQTEALWIPLPVQP